MTKNKYEYEKDLQMSIWKHSGYSVKDGVLITPNGPLLLHGVTEVRVDEIKTVGIYVFLLFSLFMTVAFSIVNPILTPLGIYFVWYFFTTHYKQVKIQYGSEKWTVAGRFSSLPFERIRAEVYTENLSELIKKNIP